MRGVVSKHRVARKSAKSQITGRYTVDGKTSFLVLVGTRRAGQVIKAWRLSVGLSAEKLARRLGHHRTYVKHLESKKNPWVLLQSDAEKLEALAIEFGESIHLHVPKPMKIFSRYVLYDDLVNLVRPRRCRGHGKLMLFPCQTQVYCDHKRDCKKLWRRKEKMK